MSTALSLPAGRSHAGRAIFGLMRSMTWKGAVAWSVVFAGVAASVAKSYSSVYPTIAERKLLPITLGGNLGFRALYGEPHAIDTVGGFTAWRIGSTMAVLAAVWMLLAATRLLRGEEDDGRWELVIGGATTAARAVAVAAVTLALWLVLAWVVLAGSLMGVGLPTAGSLTYAGSVVLIGAVFGAAGLLTSQLVPIRRRASAIAGVALGFAYLLRVVADGTTGLGWLRWFTPLGWAEQARAFAGDRVAPLALIAALAAVLTVAAVRIAATRDLGRGVLFQRDTARGRSTGLGSARSFAIRGALGPAVVWSVSMGTFAFALGLLADDVAKFIRTSTSVEQILERLGSSIGTALGYLGYTLGVVTVIAAAATGFRVVAARDEESSGRLENLLVRPVDRRRWLLWQALVAAGVGACVAFASSFLAWAGATVRGTSVPLLRLLEGGLNCVPVIVLFAGLGVLVLALAPRLTAALTLGAIAASYLIELVGALVQAPAWVLDLSAFHHVPAVPAVGADPMASVALIGFGVVFAVVGASAFGRRDIAGA